LTPISCRRAQFSAVRKWPLPKETGYTNLNTQSSLVTRGVWHKWEIMLVANTPGQLDGQAYWWMDGIKVGQYTNIGYSGLTETGTSNQWKQVVWNPTWGGGGITPPQDQFMSMDAIYVSAKP
jgi:hypothetical protein